MRGAVILLGPGKADLLEAVRDSGSLRQGAASLGMSYMRAWKLVQTMNIAFRVPLVTFVRGGAAHGGASLSPTGEKILALYRAMEESCARVTTADLVRLRSLLRKR